MNGEGVVFVYFNHRSKAFERVKISPAHAHMVIPTEKSAPIPPQTNSCSTPEISSSADTSNTRANCSTIAANARDACADCPTTTVNINAACIDPGQYSRSYKIIAPTADQPRGDRAVNNSTGGLCRGTANASESTVYFKLVESAATNPSTGQPIRQAPPVANIKSSYGTGTSMVPNPHPRILEE
jgi:hypothetical protein